MFWNRKLCDFNGSGIEVICCDDFWWNVGSWERKLRIKFVYMVVSVGVSFCVVVFDFLKYLI